ncbi:MAG: hypothetical protein A2Y79_14630 [Deltaproteobacteria bacterium RBG_13_43_22]|nr:MAG: hypothetical protein A2Y79_14630 [Deltaproteobacteria bacterium RBG_13_43_22]
MREEYKTRKRPDQGEKWGGRQGDEKSFLKNMGLSRAGTKNRGGYGEKKRQTPKIQTHLSLLLLTCLYLKPLSDPRKFRSPDLGGPYRNEAGN